jgi:hypothetical protein
MIFPSAKKPATLTGLAFVIIGCGLFTYLNIAPLWGDLIYNCGEVSYAMRLAISAQRSLLAGDVPLQFANDFDILLRPVFLYYTPLYYGAAASLQILTGLDPYRTTLVLIASMAGIASLGTYFACVSLGSSRWIAGLTSAALPFCPYFLTDAFTRGAFAELSAWSVVPWALSSFSGFVCRPSFGRASWLSFLFWILIISHKIFFPWLILCFGAFGLLAFGFRRMFQLAPALLLCSIFALAASAPYWANALLLWDSLNVISASAGMAFWHLTDNLYIFSPFLYVDPGLSSLDHFSLQLGPLIVFALLLSGFYHSDRIITALALTTLFISLAVCSFFCGGTFWIHFPKFLLAIQFPYRLLLFASTFGAVLASVVLTRLYRDSRVYFVSTIMMAAFLYGTNFWWCAGISRDSIASSYNLDFANGGDFYFEKDGPLPPELSSREITAPQFKVNSNAASALIYSDRSEWIKLPIQFSKRLVAKADGKPIEVYNANGSSAVRLVKGATVLSMERIEPIGWRLVFGSSLLVLLILFLCTRHLGKEDRLTPTVASGSYR